MAKPKQPPSHTGGIKQLIPSRLLRLFGFTTNGHQQPTPQRTQPATVDLTPYLAALDEALTNGADAGAIRTAFTALSHAERQAQWHTGETLSHADQMAAWEQCMDAFLTPMKTDAAKREQYAFLKRILREPDQHFDTVEVTATVLYKTFIQEGNGDIEYFAKRIADTNTHEQIRHNAHLITSLAEIYGSETGKRALPLILALKTSHHQNGHTAPRDYSKIFSTLGTDVFTGQDVVISQAERQQALASFGGIGSGKSTLAWNLILQDIRQNMAVVLVEPHGDLTRAVLAGIPDSDLDKVVYLDLTDCASFPYGLSPFQCDNLEDATAVAKVANFVYHTFSRVWNVGVETPRLSMVLRNVTRTLIENPGSSFADIPLLFHDAAAREKLVKNIKSPHTKLFWEQYNTMSPRERRELIASTENKIDAYLSEPLIANILSQAQSTIDFAKLLNDGNIVLINLSPQLEEISNLLGSLVIGRILMAAYQRASIPESQRIQCNVYIDEWSRFCSDDVSVLIAESRKFKVIIGGLFNQTLETISDSNRATALQAGTLVTFRVSGEDASQVLCRSYDATPTPEVVGQEPVRAIVTDVISYLLRHGSPDPAVAKFAQTYIFNCESYLRKPKMTSSLFFNASYDNFDGVLSLTEAMVHQGHKLLNDSLYQSMTEQNPDIHIDPLALYILALSQGDGREYSLSAYIISQRGPSTNRMLKGFKEPAKRLGAPSFLNPQEQAFFLAQCPHPRKYRGLAEAVVQMILDLRHCLTALANAPIHVDTGQYRPVYRQRTYTDMQAQIANELSQQENYTARVKTLRGEYTIRTHPLPTLMSEAQLAERIEEIKRRMREQGLCRPAHEVEEEVRIRHERLRQRNDAPPPSSTTGRPPRRLRQKPPPAFT